MEKWKEYPYNENYLISSYGKVKSLYKSQILGTEGGILAAKTDENGYQRVGLVILGELYKTKVWLLHRLVGEMFVDNPDNLPELIQKDGDKLNCREDNLEWATRADNIQSGLETGKINVVKGGDHWKTGTTSSRATKQAMSAAKIGKNNPKYKGYYMIDGERYYSSITAGKALRIDQKTVLRRVQSDKYPAYNFFKDLSKFPKPEA